MMRVRPVIPDDVVSRKEERGSGALALRSSVLPKQEYDIMSV